MKDINGNAIKRRYETRYWIDSRVTRPITSGFPKIEDGSIEGAGRVILRGLASKISCIDRVTGQVLWTVKRGTKVPGTRIYNVIAVKGNSQ